MIPFLFCQIYQCRKADFFADIAAVLRIFYKLRIGKFRGMDDEMADADVSCHVAGILFFTFRKRRRDSRYRQSLVTQYIMGRIRQEGTVNPAGKTDDDTSHFV